MSTVMLHTQTRLHEEGVVHGDCWPTAVECVVGLPLGTLPRWEQQECWGDYWYRVMAYLYHHHGLTTQRVDSALLGDMVTAHGYHLASGPSPRAAPGEDLYHAVVARDGAVIHDPHPTRDGLVRVDYWEFLVPVPEHWRDPKAYYVAGQPCPCGACTASATLEAVQGSAAGAE